MVQDDRELDKLLAESDEEVARRRAEADCDGSPRLVLGIDDLEANLEPALADGTLDRGIVFTDVESLDRELLAFGL